MHEAPSYRTGAPLGPGRSAGAARNVPASELAIARRTSRSARSSACLLPERARTSDDDGGMAYKPFLASGDLPQPGPVPEHLRFDMKLRVAPQVLQGVQPSDLANDIAAFANTSGGVLLIGAAEGPTGVLREYVPMDHSTAQQVVNAYGRARLECSPQPVVDARPVELPASQPQTLRYAVAVNCDPYLAPPIGVRMRGQSGGEKWWSFPVRRGAETRHLRPEELGTIMEPRLRRLSLQLSTLLPSPMGTGRRVKFYFRGHTALGQIDRIDPEQASFVVQFDTATNDTPIPLEAVRMIWTATGGTQIAIEGALDHFNFVPTQP